MIITLNLSSTLDTELRSGTQNGNISTQASKEFHEVLALHGLQPRPLFPGNSENAATPAARIWYVECPDKDAVALVKEFLNTPGVEGAYIKPTDYPPNPP